MTRGCPGVFVLSMLVGGCLAPARLQNMQLDLQDAMRRGDTAKARAVEARIGELADREYGPRSADALRQRAAALETKACWGGGEPVVRDAAEFRTEVEFALGSDERTIIPAMTEAYALANLKRWDEAEKLLDRVAVLCRPTHERPGDTGVCPGSELAYRYEEVGAFDKAAAEFVASRERLTIRFHDYELFDSSVLSNIGRRYADAGRYPEALSYLQRCLDLARPFYARPRPPSTKLIDDGDTSVSAGNAAHSFLSQEPRCLEVLLRVLPRIGKPERATELAAWRKDLWTQGPDLEKSLRVRRRFAEKAWSSDRLTSTYAHDIAFYLANKGHAEEAVVAYDDAIALLDRNRAGGRRTAYCGGANVYVDLLLGRAAALTDAGRTEEAVAAWTRAADYAAAELPPPHPWRWEPYAELAELYRRIGRLDESERSWRRYLDLVDETRGSDHADYAFGVAGLARVLEERGERAAALRARTRAQQIWQKLSVDIAAAAPPSIAPPLRSASSLDN